MVRDSKTAKKPYRAPALRILEPAAAQAKLEAVRDPLDAEARQMLSVLKHRLVEERSAAHSVSNNSLP
ncbi:MAG: hypothetical protein WA637_13685 [Terriglobales bacterium]